MYKRAVLSLVNFDIWLASTNVTITRGFGQKFTKILIANKICLMQIQKSAWFVVICQ